MRILTVLGTRPEIIRLSSIVKKLDQVSEHRLIFTGQNSQDYLSSTFFEELNLRRPDSFLECPTDSIGIFLSNLYQKLEQEIKLVRPNAFLILGDTNSALSVILAQKYGIPTYHLEAGNRSFDLNVPEEINRRTIDHTSDFNLAYTERARENLIREGLSSRFISVIGSPLKEVIDNCSTQINHSQILNSLGLIPNNYILASIHRQENVNNQSRLKLIMKRLNEAAQHFELQVVLSLHPRTKSKLSQSSISIPSSIQVHTPFSFFQYCALQKSAFVVLSDSGSISEEAAILDFPAVSIRDSIERPEALESGSILLSAVESPYLNQIIDAAKFRFDKAKHHPTEYSITDSSSRVIKFMLSTIPLYRQWSNKMEIE